MATSTNASPATPPKMPPRRLGLTGGLPPLDGPSVDVGNGAVGVSPVGATYPPPAPPAPSVVHNDVERVDEIVEVVLFVIEELEFDENVDDWLELLRNEPKPLVPVGNVNTITVPSIVVVEAVTVEVKAVVLILPTQRTLVYPDAYVRWLRMTHLMRCHF